MRPALVCLLMALAGCRSPQVTQSRIDPELASLVPADSVMLAGVKMEEVRATPLYQKLVAQQRMEELDRFAAETGFDPRRDVRDLLVASNGKDTVVLAKGKFTITSIEGATKSAYQGYTLYSNGEGGVALLNTGTAIAGRLQLVRAVIDQYKAGNRNAASTLLAKAREIPAGNQVWSVASGWGGPLAQSLPLEGNAANLGKVLRSLEDTTFSADLRSGIHAVARGYCRTAPDAKILADAVRGLVGFGRLSTPDNQPDLLRIYDGIKVEQNDRALKITADIPQNLLNKLMELLPSGRRAAISDQW